MTTLNACTPLPANHDLVEHPMAAADPHGLIASFIRCPPVRRTTPNDIFVIWMLSLRGQTTSEAAVTILDHYGATMLMSGSDWLQGLRKLFLDFSVLSLSATPLHATGD